MLEFIHFLKRRRLKPDKLSVLTALFSKITQSHFHRLPLKVLAISNSVTSREALAHVLSLSSVIGRDGLKGKHTWTHLVQRRTESTCTHNFRRVWEALTQCSGNEFLKRYFQVSATWRTLGCSSRDPSVKPG